MSWIGPVAAADALWMAPRNGLPDAGSTRFNPITPLRASEVVVTATTSVERVTGGVRR